MPAIYPLAFLATHFFRKILQRKKTFMIGFPAPVCFFYRFMDHLPDRLDLNLFIIQHTNILNDRTFDPYPLLKLAAFLFQQSTYPFKTID